MKMQFRTTRSGQILTKAASGSPQTEFGEAEVRSIFEGAADEDCHKRERGCSLRRGAQPDLSASIISSRCHAGRHRSRSSRRPADILCKSIKIIPVNLRLCSLSKTFAEGVLLDPEVHLHPPSLSCHFKHADLYLYSSGSSSNSSGETTDETERLTPRKFSGEPFALRSVVCNAILGCTQAPPPRRLTFPLIHSEAQRESTTALLQFAAAGLLPLMKVTAVTQLTERGPPAFSAARFVHWIQVLDPSSAAQKHSGSVLSVADFPCSDVTLVIRSDSCWTDVLSTTSCHPPQ
ncbi:hypothetical protein FQA47_001418 [Oryzias melastigma]|uniref:Uncharacterized protein n=1 Tax=Oryzias melastigma TaxID=30732 RepID=A0A834FSC1_ORYME|nr:hypothetical protein FQA47_001418 [Oryzias melastigma]